MKLFKPRYVNLKITENAYMLHVVCTGQNCLDIAHGPQHLPS